MRLLMLIGDDILYPKAHNTRRYLEIRIVDRYLLGSHNSTT